MGYLRTKNSTLIRSMLSGSKKTPQNTKDGNNTVNLLPGSDLIDVGRKLLDITDET